MLKGNGRGKIYSSGTALDSQRSRVLSDELIRLGVSCMFVNQRMFIFRERFSGGGCFRAASLFNQINAGHISESAA